MADKREEHDGHVDVAALPVLDRIELRHLEQIIEICRAGSFSDAARRLQLSQPALSKSISRLEGQLKLRLFERSGGAAKPTPLAHLVARRGQQLLDASNALRRELEQRAGGVSGQLRIGVGPVTQFRPLPQVMGAMLTRFPNLRLETSMRDGRKIMSGVHQGRFDLAFGDSDIAEEFSDLIRVTIFEDRMMVVARPGHPATTAAAPLSASELLQYPLGSVGLTVSFRRWISGVSDAALCNATALMSDNLELIRNCLPQNYTMRAPLFMVEEALAAGELVEVPVQWDHTYRCWMLTTAENWRLPVVKAVADIARIAVNGPGV
jgi:DNA-binding transcriptional LysR family regulator